MRLRYLHDDGHDGDDERCAPGIQGVPFELWPKIKRKKKSHKNTVFLSKIKSNPTVTSYNDSAVKFYSATIRLGRFENKIILLYC
jgi:hypothetical protein